MQSIKHFLFFNVCVSVCVCAMDSRFQIPQQAGNRVIVVHIAQLKEQEQRETKRDTQTKRAL